MNRVSVRSVIRIFRSKIIIIVVSLILILINFRVSISASGSAAIDYTPGMIINSNQGYEALMRNFSTSNIKRLIVTLRPASYQPEGNLSSSFAVQAQRQSLRQLANGLSNRFQATSAVVLASYDTMPIMVIQADASAVQILSTAPEIASVVEDTFHPAGDLESNNIIGAPNAWAQGYDGTGWTIVILDSGVQTSHPFLANKVVAEACFSSTVVSSLISTTVCPNGQSTNGNLPGQVGAGAGINCPIEVDGCAHGTHVAGIIVGRSYASGPNYDGVARGANLISLQVESRVEGIGCGQMGFASPCVAYWDSDLIAALNYVYTTLSAQYHIAAVNMSLVGRFYSGSVFCNYEPSKAAIDNLRSINIATVIAAGNNGQIGMTAPSCIEGAISVGATNDSDVLAPFSNRSGHTTLLAPGANIVSSVPENTYASFSGTSMAAPQVAGAFAIMKQKSPNSRINKIMNILRGRGMPISTDGFTIPRLQVNSALADFGNLDTIGIFRPALATFFMRYTNSTGFANKVIVFGRSSDIPLVGDWNGDGVDTVGVYRNGQFLLSDSTNNPASVTYSYLFGVAGDKPLVIDWDGDGKDNIGVYRPSTGILYIDVGLPAGFPNLTMAFGSPGDIGLAGDWDGNGGDSIGVYRTSLGQFFLTNTLTFGSAYPDYSVTFGEPGDIPFVGDWNGDGITGLGVYRPSNGLVYLRNDPTSSGFADIAFVFGSSGDVPISGNWQQAVNFQNNVPNEIAPPFVPVP